VLKATGQKDVAVYEGAGDFEWEGGKKTKTNPKKRYTLTKKTAGARTRNTAGPCKLERGPLGVAPKPQQGSPPAILGVVGKAIQTPKKGRSSEKR